MCGEQRGGRGIFMACLGSPPRVRGTGYAHRGPPRYRGITPACAGNSGKYGSKFAQSWDHPRVCGEQFRGLIILRRCIGSPPRVRGTAGLGLSGATGLGITPACAGNSRPTWFAHLLRGDHPRVCGEQVIVFSVRFRIKGSPPRVRGTGILIAVDLRLQGITPACAGNRAEAARSGSGRKDHPRVCGEQSASLSRASAVMGSPPRVRGTAAGHQDGGYPGRITPACAGNRRGDTATRTQY